MVKKARRLLVDGHVHIIRAGDGELVARVKGDHSVYTVSKEKADRVRCTCPSLKWRCSHIIAVELVTRGWPS